MLLMSLTSGSSEYRGDRSNNHTWVLLLQVQTQNQQTFEQAVADLRYGCVAVNVTSMMGFCIARLPWGGFPGNTLEVRVLIAYSCISDVRQPD